ncbi:MAG: hypothetical protein WKG06_39955 [Segetibacter sp.]
MILYLKTGNLNDCMHETENICKKAGLVTAGLALSEIAAVAAWRRAENKLPKWKGFNLLDFFHLIPNQHPNQHTEDHFQLDA